MIPGLLGADGGTTRNEVPNSPGPVPRSLKAIPESPGPPPSFLGLVVGFLGWFFRGFRKRSRVPGAGSGFPRADSGKVLDAILG